MYKRKVNDLNSDGMDDIHNPPSMYRKKPKVNDLHSEGLDETHKPLTVGVDTMQFENIILYDNHEYKRKLELGKKIYEFIYNKINIRCIISDGPPVY